MCLADLHVHSSVSDCSMDAESILKEAKDAGVTHLAFTDHDTTELAREHVELAAQYGICAVPGVEMSAYDYKKDRKVHILGYAYAKTKYIEQIGSETLRKRNENCLKQIGILNELGYHVPVEEVKKLAGKCIYKQHILDYLVKTGQSRTLFGDIYKNVFKNGGPCDFDIQYPDAEDCVRAIKADGGFAVLAHPGQLGNYCAIHRLAEAGLDGIEFNHPSHSASDKKRVEEFARSYSLFMTGGSDFHGRYEKTLSSLGQYPAPESSRVIFENR